MDDKSEVTDQGIAQTTDCQKMGTIEIAVTGKALMYGNVDTSSSFAASPNIEASCDPKGSSSRNSTPSSVESDDESDEETVLDSVTETNETRLKWKSITHSVR